MNAIEYIPMRVSMSVHRPEKQAHKPVAVQNGTVLYGKAEPGLIPEGWHLAELIDVRRFANVFGERVGLVFKIASGPHLGIELMEAAALKASPRGVGANANPQLFAVEAAFLPGTGRRRRMEALRRAVPRAGRC